MGWTAGGWWGWDDVVARLAVWTSAEAPPRIASPSSNALSGWFSARYSANSGTVKPSCPRRGLQMSPLRMKLRGARTRRAGLWRELARRPLGGQRGPHVGTHLQPANAQPPLPCLSKRQGCSLYAGGCVRWSLSIWPRTVAISACCPDIDASAAAAYGSPAGRGLRRMNGGRL
jgi:hypothetical protein